ncbi:site-specific integrase [Streptomyces sp. NPDC101160]|uniref:site-specific integrase n=1 Tax=Streptomyces sp. NPDC101160 TaxID=3366118 RepID=UPI0038162FF6
MRNALGDVLAFIGLTDASGQPLDFAPHDFRRMFITDAIRSGLPPHIAQVIVGHTNINTTMGYNAIYPTETIEAHRAFITRRRTLRPAEEYRTPTDAEWEDFLGHFERRKLSVGTCARAYGTACIHEHAPLTERTRLIVQFRAQVGLWPSTVCGRDERSCARAGSVAVGRSPVWSAGGDRRPVRALPARRRRRRGRGAGRGVLPGAARSREGGGDRPLVPARGRGALGSSDARGRSRFQLLDPADGQAARDRGQAAADPHRRRPEPGDRETTPGPGYAPPTVAHSETVLRRFYDLHRDAGSGPLLNPFPLDLARRSGRAHAHHNPMDAWAPERTGRYRPTVPRRIPRSIPDE